MHSLVRRYLKTGIGFLALGLTYWLVAGGTALRVVCELARQEVSSIPMRVAVVVTGLLQVSGIAVFFLTMWSRIRPLGSQTREAQGERF